MTLVRPTRIVLTVAAVAALAAPVGARDALGPDSDAALAASASADSAPEGRDWGWE